MTWATATAHAKERARKRYGVELSESLWHAMALSLAAGDARRIGPGAGGLTRWAVRMLRDDGTEFEMPVVFDHASRTIVTVLPPKKASRPKPPPRKQDRPLNPHEARRQR